MDRSATVLPFYYGFTSSRGYQVFNDTSLIPNEIVRTVQSKSGVRLSNHATQFDSAFEFAFLHGEDEFLVFARHKRIRVARDEVVVSCYWLMAQKEWTTEPFSLGSVFAELNKVPLEDPGQFDLRPRTIVVDSGAYRQSDVLANNRLLRQAESALIGVTEGIALGLRYVVVGVNDLSEQLEFVDALRLLLPGSIARQISFLTAAPDLYGTSSDLVFATLAPNSDIMGRVLRKDGDALTSLVVYQPAVYQARLASNSHLLHYRRLQEEAKSEFGKDSYYQTILPQIQRVAISKTLLSAPEMWVPMVDRSVGIDLFRRRYQNGRVTPSELLYHLESYGRSMPVKDVQAYAERALDLYLQGGYVASDSARLKLVFAQNPVDLVLLGRHAQTRFEEVNHEYQQILGMLTFFDALAAAKPGSATSEFNETMAQLVDVAVRECLVRQDAWLYELVGRYVNYVEKRLIAASIEALPDGMVVNWRSGKWSKELHAWKQNKLDSSDAYTYRGVLVTVVKALMRRTIRREGLHAALDAWLWLIREEILDTIALLAVCPLGAEMIGTTKPTETERTVIVETLFREVLKGSFGQFDLRFRSKTNPFWNQAELKSAPDVMDAILGTKGPLTAEQMSGLFTELENRELYLMVFEQGVEKYPKIVTSRTVEDLGQIARSGKSADTAERLRRVTTVIANTVSHSSDPEVLRQLEKLASILHMDELRLKLVLLLPPQDGTKRVLEIVDEIIRRPNFESQISAFLGQLVVQPRVDDSLLSRAVLKSLHVWPDNRPLTSSMLDFVDRYIILTDRLDFSSDYTWRIWAEFWRGNPSMHRSMQISWLSSLITTTLRHQGLDDLVDSLQQAESAIMTASSVLDRRSLIERRSLFAGSFGMALSKCIPHIDAGRNWQTLFSLDVELGYGQLPDLAEQAHQRLQFKLAEQPEKHAEALIEALKQVERAFRWVVRMSAAEPEESAQWKMDTAVSRIERVCIDIDGLLREKQQKRRFPPLQQEKLLIVVDKIKDSQKLNKNKSRNAHSLPVPEAIIGVTESRSDWKTLWILNASLRILLEWDSKPLDLSTIRLDESEVKNLEVSCAEIKELFDMVKPRLLADKYRRAYYDIGGQSAANH